jgi:hypothetical protein
MIAKVFGRIALAVVFFALVTPVGFVMRFFGRDPLRWRLDREAASYWIARDAAPDRRQTAMTRQF